MLQDRFWAIQKLAAAGKPTSRIEFEHPALLQGTTNPLITATTSLRRLPLDPSRRSPAPSVLLPGAWAAARIRAAQFRAISRRSMRPTFEPRLYRLSALGGHMAKIPAERRCADATRLSEQRRPMPLVLDDRISPAKTARPPAVGIYASDVGVAAAPFPQSRTERRRAPFLQCGLAEVIVPDVSPPGVLPNTSLSP